MMKGVMVTRAKVIRWGACGLGVSILLAATLPASAQSNTTTTEPNPDDRRTAFYRAGVSAAAAGNWGEAKESFRAALAIRVSPKVVFSLAQAEHHLGQLASARADYLRAAEGARVTPGEGDVVANAEQAERAIEPLVPHVRIVVLGSSAATATLDEQPIGVGEVVPVDPGAHRVVVSALGMRPLTMSVAVVQGQLLDVPAQLERQPLAPSVPEPAPPTAVSPPSVVGPERESRAASRPLPWKTVGVVATGIGVAGLGVATGFAFVAKSKNDQSHDTGYCSGDICTPQGVTVRDEALSAATGATVATIAGTVLVAGGLALWLFGPSSTRDSRVTVAPVALGTGGALVVAGVWH
jgi:hypothetical protein